MRFRPRTAGFPAASSRIRSQLPSRLPSFTRRISASQASRRETSARRSTRVRREASLLNTGTTIDRLRFPSGKPAIVPPRRSLFFEDHLLVGAAPGARQVPLDGEGLAVRRKGPAVLDRQVVAVQAAARLDDQDISLPVQFAVQRVAQQGVLVVLAVRGVAQLVAKFARPALLRD